jgi:hypothetical protein
MADFFQELSRNYSTPKKVQAFLRHFKYNHEKKGETAHSARRSFALKKAHCLEACLLAAAILEKRGYPPLVLSLDSSDHICHALFVFRSKTGWGAIGRSRLEGLHGRAPKYRSIRELALSYSDPFVDATGSLIGYTLLNLNDSKTDWRFSKRNLWKLEQFIVTAKHVKLKMSKSRFLKLRTRFLTQGELRTGKNWW